MSKTKANNIYEIAEATGFSPSTVARALRGDGYCKKETRDKILKTAKSLSYTPNQAAKILRSNITNKIIFCIPDILNPYYFQMIRGVSDVMEQNGYHTILASSQRDINREIGLINELNTRFVDGMILGSFDFSPRLMEVVEGSDYPFVLTNMVENDGVNKNYDCVYIDHIKAVYIATEHLIQKGHRNISLLVGNVSEQTGFERAQGYINAFKDNNIPYRDELVIQSDHTYEGGYRSFSEFMKQGIDISAVVACNDLMGVGAMNFCHEKGFHIPDDIAIVTLDDTDYCICAFPQLSSVQMMQYQVGEYSAKLLLERIKGERVRHKAICFDPALKIREST